MALSLVATAVLSSVMLAGAAAAGAGKPSPALRITTLDPVHVTGRHFRPSERVRLVATSNGESIRRTLRATRSGAFRATFVQIKIVDRCSADLLLQAVGGRGSRAVAKLPQVQCPPRLAPS
jgi:hypothetical protein